MTDQPEPQPHRLTDDELLPLLVVDEVNREAQRTGRRLRRLPWPPCVTCRKPIDGITTTVGVLTGDIGIIPEPCGHLAVAHPADMARLDKQAHGIARAHANGETVCTDEGFCPVHGSHPHRPEQADTPDPLAPFRALADQYAAKAAESLRNAKASNLDEARTALQDVAAGWAGAEFLLRHTLADLDNSRTTPDNPPASDDTRRRALAHNAVGTALNAHGQWLPLSVREAVADAVLAAIDDPAASNEESAQLARRLDLAHRARRATEAQLDDVRRALCDTGLIDDNDPYSHAALADVIRQTMTSPNPPAPGAAVTDDPPDLRQQYAEAIRNGAIFDCVTHVIGYAEEIADAVLAVRDRELERLQTQLAALAALAEIARGYCPHCGRGDAAPTVDQYLEQVRIAENADIILDRVRAIAVDLRDDPDARYWANLLDTALDTPEHP